MGCLKKILIGVGVLVVLAVVASFFASPNTTNQTPVADVPISEINFSELDEIYQAGSTYTNIQKDENWKKYDGKKVKWTGTISEISESFGNLNLQVKMKETTFVSDLIITLKEDQKDKALKLSVGDTVTFIGILDEWGTILPISLKDGEIVPS